MHIEDQSFEAETEMQQRARARILASSDWVAAQESSLLLSALRAGLIFSIEHNGAKLFPLYGLEHDLSRPLPAMKQVLDSMHATDPWKLAFWFDAANSYLDGRRPQDVIRTEPDKVVSAALEEISWVNNG